MVDFHGIEASFARSVHRFHPVGETASAKGFCLLLARLIKIWEGAMAPPLEARLVNHLAGAAGGRWPGMALLARVPATAGPLAAARRGARSSSSRPASSSREKAGSIRTIFAIAFAIANHSQL
jgi:hypothetical protein